MSTEIEKAEQGGALAASPQEQALGQSFKDSIDSTSLILPNVKLTQGLTNEVVDGVVGQGCFFNTLTEEDYGGSIEFVVFARFFGHFHRNADGEGFSARGDVVPENWPEQYRGKRFVELDDAEERFRELVNEGAIEWGSGPPISRTTNFVGLVVSDESGLPVRISMMRGNSKAAQKIETMIKAGRGQPWDRTFTLSAEKQMSKRNEPFFGIKVGRGGPTDPELRQLAVTYAQDYAAAEAAGRVQLAGDDDEGGAPKRKKAAPKASEDALSMD